LLALGAALAMAGCGGGSAKAAPTATPAPTPTPTPNPHLAEPASVDDVFVWLNAHGLAVVGNNADRGQSGEPVKRINATYAGWPLILSQYSSSAVARMASGVAGATSRPVADQAPFTFVGLNIVADFGPHLRTDGDAPPDGRFVAAATALADALDPLLGPLHERAAVRIPLPTIAPSPTPAGASPTPSPAKATTSPKPSSKATPKPSSNPKATPKPTG
jgi:hypothetical protein